MDSVLTAKVICLVLFLVSTLTAGLLPLILRVIYRRCKKPRGEKKKKHTWIRLAVSCFLCGGGGVLLATVFVHLLPEIRHVLAGAHFTHKTLPVGEIILCGGFFLIWLIEECVHFFMHSRTNDKRSVQDVTPTAPEKVTSAGDMEANSWNQKNIKNGTSVNSLVSANSVSTLVPGNDSISTSSNEEAPQHGHSHAPGDLATVKAIRAFMVLIALSVHAIFEGMAVGLEEDFKNVWLLWAAIMMHKVVLSFFLGEQLVGAKRSICFTFSAVLTFAMASPAGIAIAIIVEVSGTDLNAPEQMLTNGILQGIATGTLLYVVFFEILLIEKQKEKHGLLKFLCTLAGFVIMVIIQGTSGHHHHHGHGTLKHGHSFHSHSTPHLHHNHSLWNGTQEHDHDHDHSTFKVDERQVQDSLKHIIKSIESNEEQPDNHVHDAHDHHLFMNTLKEMIENISRNLDDEHYKQNANRTIKLIEQIDQTDHDHDHFGHDHGHGDHGHGHGDMDNDHRHHDHGPMDFHDHSSHQAKLDKRKHEHVYHFGNRDHDDHDDHDDHHGHDDHDDHHGHDHHDSHSFEHHYPHQDSDTSDHHRHSSEEHEHNHPRT